MHLMLVLYPPPADPDALRTYHDEAAFLAGPGAPEGADPANLATGGAIPLHVEAR